ncbi:MAG TPA: serine hydrolase domain-containing protein [Puia sp.]|nr:serine hydrolase domain-containing protein [Puia sp.]
MKKIFFLFCLFVSQFSFSQAVNKRIDSLLNSIYKSNEPGIAIAIQENGKVIFENGYGLANLETKEKNSPASNFNIGSLTKQFTAFGILKLASAELISLDDSIIKFFPQFNKKVGSIITIRQLLTHSSGIIDHYAFVDTNIVKHATDKDVFNAVKNIDSTYFPPGTKYRYSNTAYCLLALIIEKVSGLAYPYFIKQNIFSLLYMNNSQVLKINNPITNRVLGYDTSQNSFKKLDASESIFFSTQGDGGIYTSINDYLKWFNSLQSGLLLDRQWIEKARSPQFPVDAKNKLSYGFGWFINEQNEFKEVYHTGSNGGFRAIAFSIPSKNYLIIILSNRTGVDLENIVQEINKILGVAGNFYTKIDALES